MKTILLISLFLFPYWLLSQTPSPDVSLSRKIQQLEQWINYTGQLIDNKKGEIAPYNIDTIRLKMNSLSNQVTLSSADSSELNKLKKQEVHYYTIRKSIDSLEAIQRFNNDELIEKTLLLQYTNQNENNRRLLDEAKQRKIEDNRGLIKNFKDEVKRNITTDIEVNATKTIASSMIIFKTETGNNVKRFINYTQAILTAIATPILINQVLQKDNNSAIWSGIGVGTINILAPLSKDIFGNENEFEETLEAIIRNINYGAIFRQDSIIRTHLLDEFKKLDTLISKKDNNWVPQGEDLALIKSCKENFELSIQFWTNIIITTEELISTASQLTKNGSNRLIENKNQAKEAFESRKTRFESFNVLYERLVKYVNESKGFTN